MCLRLVAVSRIGTLVVDLHHHARTHRAPIGGKPVTLGRYVPALAAAFADSGDYAGGAAVDGVVAEVCAAGVGEVVGGGETGAVVAGCGGSTGDGGAAGGVPGEGGGKNGVRIRLCVCGGKRGGEEEEERLEK